MIKLQHVQDALVLEAAGASILNGLPSTVSLCNDASHATDGAMVLGISSNEGAVSCLDVDVGKVRERGEKPHGAYTHTDACCSCFLLTPQLSSSHLLACARCKLWWMTPEWVDSTRNLPPETQVCSGL